MTRMTRTIAAVAALLCTEGLLTPASAGSGGSAYSLSGIGDIRYTPGSRSSGMGYAGIGLAPPQFINGESPATWSRINRTRLEGSALYEGFGSTDGIRSRYLARLDFNGALLAVPIAPASGIVLVGGFLPYSNISYDTYTPGSYYRISGADTTKLDYRLHHVGTGGITKAVFGLSWSPTTSLSMGVSFNYLFGTLSSSIDQLPTTTDAASGIITDDRTMRGVNFTVGFLYTGLESIAEPFRPFSLGVVLTSRANLRTTTQTTYQYTLERDTSAEVFGKLAVPFSVGIGLGYQPAERWSFAADYTAQPWSSADFGSLEPSGLRNSYRIGVGAERTGNKESTAPWLDRLSYRLGFTYHQTYYIFNGQPINEYSVTAGMSFPLAGESRLNMAAEYGTRGITTNNLIKDNIFRMNISVSISDLMPWFVRTEED